LKKHEKKREMWIIDEDGGCRFVYDKIFSQKFEIIYFDHFEHASSMVRQGIEPDFVICDFKLSDNAFYQCLEVNYHGQNRKFPIIVVSAIEEMNALRRCFDLGVKDYITKPFRKNELLVKVENILRKMEREQPDRHFGITGKDVVIDGVTIDNLTAKQVQILSLFFRSQERTVSRKNFYQHIWGKTQVNSKALDAHIYYLRRKIAPYGLQIRSIREKEWSENSWQLCSLLQTSNSYQ